MPLVYAGFATTVPTTRTRERALKIDPARAQGEPIAVAFVRNQVEAEMAQNLLLDDGIPSLTKRSFGFDVPDYLATGPRDILVPASAAEVARDLLRDIGVQTIDPATPGAGVPRLRIVLGVLAGSGLAALVAWLLVHAGG